VHAEGYDEGTERGVCIEVDTVTGWNLHSWIEECRRDLVFDGGERCDISQVK
jgi:hypothetical protein